MKSFFNFDSVSLQRLLEFPKNCKTKIRETFETGPIKNISLHSGLETQSSFRNQTESEHPQMQFGRCWEFLEKLVLKLRNHLNQLSLTHLPF